MTQRLLVSVRGEIEALVAAQAGAHIVDVEYPASALGTSYPFTIERTKAAIVKKFPNVQVSTNTGEFPFHRGNACQTALGVATAGADLIKFGLAEMPLEAAVYLGEKVVETIRHWDKTSKKKVYPAVFVDEAMQRYFKPLKDSLSLVKQIKADGVLIDTFEKSIGKGLLDYVKLTHIKLWVRDMHKLGKEAWIAGSIKLEELPQLWRTGVDVVCVRGAACSKDAGNGRFGSVDAAKVKALVATLKSGSHRGTKT